MKIYRLKMLVYNYWYTCDREGFQEEEKLFSTKEKALRWIDEHPRYAHTFNGVEAEKERQLPKFEIEEIEVE